ncbi:MAG: hypothetical protein WC047_00415 [Kiritimatiellales bacterium]
MEYLFYIGGLGLEKWVVGESEKAAHKALWDGLDDYEKDRVAYIECIDQR